MGQYDISTAAGLAFVQDALNQMPGVRMDGVSDDTAAFQAVIDATPSGGVVPVPGRTMRIDGRLETYDKHITFQGAGSAATTIIKTGGGGLFSVGNSGNKYLSVSGMALVAASPNCGTALDIDYETSTGLSQKTSDIEDVVCRYTGEGYWTKGIRINNARNSIIADCYVHGPISLATTHGILVDGEATDVKLYGNQVTSVARGVDVGDDAEGTIIDGFVAVGVNEGIVRYSDAGDPWISIDNFHINAIQKGIHLTNAIQSLVGDGLIYVNQAASNGWVGIEIDGASSEEIKLGMVQINGELNPGITATGLLVTAAARVVGRIMPRRLTTAVDLKASADRCDIELLFPTNVGTEFADAGTNNSKSVINSVGKLFGNLAAYSHDYANSINKNADLNFYANDTAKTKKQVSRIRTIPSNSNWTGADLVLSNRSSDALVEAIRFLSSGGIRVPLASLPAYADDAAAASGGLSVGDLYRTGSAIKIRAS